MVHNIEQKIELSEPELLISKQLTDKLTVAFMCVDSAMRVTQVSDNLAYYGYTDVPLGANVEDYVDFMVGMTPTTDIDLAFVSSPVGVPIAVSLMPNNNELVVLITDVSQQAEQRRLLQQKANENELLLRKQKTLMAELANASKTLELKNKELEEASRLQTRFLSGVSHEFRTPLTSIIGHTNLAKAELLKDKSSSGTGPKVDDCHNHLHAVQRSSKHLLSLVENLLDHGKFDSNEIVLHPKPTNLRELFNDVELLLRPLSQAKLIEFVVDTSIASDIDVAIDDSRLRQCLINLVGNAIKFTDEGSVRVESVLADDMLNVNITDTGIGIKPEDIEKAKRPFWQAHGTGKAGTGLGLTITENIIELMGGELSLTSQFGVGTHVSFELLAPLVSAEIATTPNTSLSSDYQILLVEDDADIANLLLVMFAEKNLNVTHAENGEVALDIMSNRDFDLVLMDLNMPIMGGHEAVQALRDRGDITPVVIMSASALEGDKIRAQELACDGYLVKPVDIADIITLANELSDRSPRELNR